MTAVAGKVVVVTGGRRLGSALVDEPTRPGARKVYSRRRARRIAITVPLWSRIKSR